MSDTNMDEFAKLDALAVVEELKSRNSIGMKLNVTEIVIPGVSSRKEEVEVEALGLPIFADWLIDNVKIGQKLNVTDITIPERMKHNISTGHEKVDILMAGDGVTPSTVCLLTGTPGAGKSTLAAQLADCITKAGHIAIYNMCEESLIQLAKVSKRLHIKNGFYVSSHRNVFDLVEHVNKIAEEHPNQQVFLFADSLQTLELPHIMWDEKTGLPIRDKEGNTIKAQGRVPGHQTMEVLVTRILACWAKSTFGIVFLVGQVNKDGEMAGRQAIKHDIDVHMHLSIQTVRDTTGRFTERICEITKNRFGIANIYFPFELEARGIKFLEHRPKK